VRLREPDWTFDEQELAAAFNDRTRAIIINTPNNPTGKVFTRSELQVIARLCQQVGRAGDYRRDLRAHHLRRTHARADRSRFDGMAERTVTINGPVEDLQRHRMAGRLGNCAARISPGRFERCTTS
jgi:aminotransferase